MKLSFFNLSGYDKKILEDCPTMQYGASYINLINYFPLLVTSYSAFISLGLLGFDYFFTNVMASLIFTLIHVFFIKNTNNLLHKKRNWEVLIFSIVLATLISFIQVIIFGNYIFQSEYKLHSILKNINPPVLILDKIIFYLKQPFYIFSFENTVVSMMTIALLIVLIFIGILPYIMIYFYRNSKYYFTEEKIKDFKLKYEKLQQKYTSTLH